MFTISPTSSESLQSSGSDFEFWTGLDSKPCIPKSKNASQLLLDESTRPISAIDILDEPRNFELNVELMKRASARESPISRVRSVQSEDRTYHRFEKRLEMIRRAKNVEVTNSSLLVKHNATNEYEAKLKALNHAFLQQKSEQLKEVEQLKMMLTMKSAETARFRQLVEEQEFIIAQMRIKSEKSTPGVSRCDSRMKTGKFTESASNTELYVEMQKAKEQLDSLQQICNEYRSDALTNAQEAKALREKNALLKHKLSQYENSSNLEITKVKENADFQITELEGKMRNLQEIANTESKVNTELRNRMQDTIKTLQEELRTAKLVLTHPKLRAKVFTRLKDIEDALKEIKDMDDKPSPSPAPKIGKSGRRKTRPFHMHNSIGKIWNPQDHSAYLKSAELDTELHERSKSSRRDVIAGSRASDLGKGRLLM